MVKFWNILIVLILFSACQSGRIACPHPEKVKLKKHAGINYKVLIARARNSKKITKSELRQLQAREVKTVGVEEWDCPKPGTKNTPKQVQNNIRKNRKKFESYYKHRENIDSLQFPIDPQSHGK